MVGLAESCASSFALAFLISKRSGGDTPPLRLGVVVGFPTPEALDFMDARVRIDAFCRHGFSFHFPASPNLVVKLARPVRPLWNVNASNGAAPGTTCLSNVQKPLLRSSMRNAPNAYSSDGRGDVVLEGASQTPATIPQRFKRSVAI